MKKEKIPGGLSKGKSLKDIAIMHAKSSNKGKPDEKEIEKMHDYLKLQLKKGIKTELEHTDDKNVAREIAIDHIYEDPKYYTKLSKIEEMRNTKKLNLSVLSEMVKREMQEQNISTASHQDHEAKMAKAELRDMVKNAKEIYSMISEGDSLPGWISAYITLASDYMHSVNEYMVEHNSDGQELDEYGNRVSLSEIKKIIKETINEIDKEQGLSQLKALLRQNPDDVQDLLSAEKEFKTLDESDDEYMDYGTMTPISKKEYIKSKLIGYGVSTAVGALVGALMAGPFGAMAPHEALEAILAGAGIIGPTLGALTQDVGKVRKK